MTKTLAQLLKEERERKGLSQEALGKLLGVTQQTVAQWESGNAQPRNERRQRLMQILGMHAHGVEQARPPADFLRATEVFHAKPIPPRPPYSEIRERDDAALRDALPPALHNNLDGRLGIGNMQRQLGYLSASAAVEIKRVTMPRILHNVLSPALLRLAVARQLGEASGQYRHCLLIVVSEGPLPLRMLNHIAFDAGVLGISVEHVRTMADVAAILTAVEEAGPEFHGIGDESSLDYPPDDLDENE